jgi:RNA polymerase sigma factor (TIGR02999 family)
MAVPSSVEVTQLLLAWSQGEPTALEKLVPLVHAELSRLAHHYMAGERTGHTLQTTALVNEAFLRLVDSSQVRWQNRAHFMAVSAQLMRRILVDFARSRNYLKRGAGAQQVPLDEAMVISEAPDLDVVELDRALVALAAVDARKSQVVELRFFGGLTEEEAAEVLKVSPETVRRDLRLARLGCYGKWTSVRLKVKVVSSLRYQQGILDDPKLVFSLLHSDRISSDCWLLKYKPSWQMRVMVGASQRAVMIPTDE